MASSEPKQELPLATETEIVELVEAFETGTLPYVHWTHRAHLAVAVRYVRTMPHDAALTRIRERIGAYNACCGDPTGYNETITRLYLMRLRDDTVQGIAEANLAAELSRASASYGVDWLYGYYSKDRIWSTEAAAAWIEPDRKSLDFFVI
ncbi:hypothetical protein GC170_14840 [bacterium]|nr:hypothetical protein [bacterium]